MSGEWTPMLLAIHNAIITMGTFQEPLEEKLIGISLSQWQLIRAERILAAVEWEIEKEIETLREEEIKAEEEAAKLSPPKRGWNWVLGATKWHYFDENGRSLCGHWQLWSGNLDAEDDRDDHSDNCKLCQKKVKQMREKEQKDGGADEGAVAAGGAVPVFAD